MGPLRAILDDPAWRLNALGTAVVGTVAFALFATPLTLLAWLEPAWARSWRIQLRRPRAQDLVGRSIVRWLANTAVAFALMTVAWPWVHFGRAAFFPLPSWHEVLGQFLVFVYLDDLLFYWAHRALHGRWLFKHVHAVHHRIYTPWAITGNYSHPAEFVITATLALLGPALFHSHPLTIWIWIAWRQWEAAEGHCGYDLPFSPSLLLPGSDGALHHDFHHAKVRGNYAGFLRHVDTVFGTLAKGYAEHRAKRA